MTREDIIRIAREVFDVETDGRGRETFSGDNYGVERFAALIITAKVAEYQDRLEWQQRSYEREIQLEVEAEREECAQIADAEASIDGIAQRISAAIRSRSNT